MTAASVPTRWIACVDGTWCTPDGAYGLPHAPDKRFKRVLLTVYLKAIDMTILVIYTVYAPASKLGSVWIQALA